MSYWILCLFPDMDTTPIRPMYEMQWWSQDKDHLKAWQKGNSQSHSTLLHLETSTKKMALAQKFANNKKSTILT